MSTVSDRLPAAVDDLVGFVKCLAVLFEGKVCVTGDVRRLNDSELQRLIELDGKVGGLAAAAGVKILEPQYLHRQRPPTHCPFGFTHLYLFRNRNPPTLYLQDEWLQRMTGLRAAALAAEESMRELDQASDKALAHPPRITVDLAAKTLTLDGKTYDVSSRQALRWLRVLTEYPGVWISGAELRGYDQELDGVRTDRIKEYLPEPIRELIDSDPGKGSRLRLP